MYGRERQTQNTMEKHWENNEQENNYYYSIVCLSKTGLVISRQLLLKEDIGLDAEVVVEVSQVGNKTKGSCLLKGPPMAQLIPEVFTVPTGEVFGSTVGRGGEHSYSSATVIVEALKEVYPSTPPPLSPS